MKKTAIYLGLAISAMILILAACSDKSANNAKTEGDYNDPAFLQAKSFADYYVDTTFSATQIAMGYRNFDGTGPLSVAGDSLNIVYNPDLCWWMIYISSDTTGFHLLVTDSVKFVDVLSACQQFPDSVTTDQIDYYAYMEVALDDTLSSFDISGYQRANISGFQTDQIVINGTSATQMGMTINLTTYDIAYSASVTDLTFLTADVVADTAVYPLSGGMEINMAMAVVSVQGGASYNWYLVITFGTTGYHAYAESGDNYWEWDEPYGG